MSKEKNIIFNGFEIRSAEPLDQRLILDTLDGTNLIAKFGSSGEYSYDGVVIYVKDTQAFYYNTLNANLPSNDAVNPANWSEVSSAGLTKFQLYDSNTTYSLGDGISYLFAPGDYRFYIANQSVAVGEDPITTPSKWLEVSATSGITRTLEAEIQPNDPLTHTISLSNEMISFGSSIPDITVRADFGNRNGSNIIWENVNPKIEIDKTGDLIDIIFQADIENSDLFWSSGTGNCKITLS